MNALKGAWSDEPNESMKPALVFEAIIAVVIVPFPLCLNLWVFKSQGGGRLDVDRGFRPVNGHTR